jgi:hypothetical protein
MSTQGFVMTQNFSPAEIYAIHLENDEPAFYSRVPHIIDHLTYDYVNPKTGKTIPMRLSVHAKEFYRVIKSIAGDFGACWQNRDKLAELCNMSAGMITSVKKELQQNFHQLNHSPLIAISKEIKTIKSGGVVKSGCVYDKIKILHIWHYNNAYMKTIQFQKKTGILKLDNEIIEDEAPSKSDDVSTTPSNDDEVSPVTPSPPVTNNITLNKNPLSLEQQPAVDTASVCPLSNQDKLFSLNQEAQKIIAYLVNEGFSEKHARNLQALYTKEDLKNAIDYSVKQIKINRSKGKDVPNKLGYL